MDQVCQQPSCDMEVYVGRVRASFEQIPIATLDRATEPFFTTKAVGKGTGLGLSMVHGFVGQLGGRLVLRSERGVGTIAELWLPEAQTVAVPLEPQPAPPQRVDGRHGARGR